MRRLGDWRYSDSDLLGRGSTANCYRCVTPAAPGSARAIKVFHDPYAANWLEDEVNALQSIGPHSGSPSLFDFGRDSKGRLCIVTELAHGVRLDRKLQREGPLDLHWVGVLVEDMLHILQCAHSKGFLHKDIKPENVLFDGTHFHLLDWGSAQAIGNGQTHTVRSRMDYLAPECYYGTHGVATDFYALACLVTEVASGRPPFNVHPPGNHLAAACASCLDTPEIDTERLGLWNHLLLHWLDKDPEARPVAYTVNTLLDSSRAWAGSRDPVTPSGAESERQASNPDRKNKARIPWVQCQRAMEHMRAKRTQDALRLLESAAASAYAEAQYRLGRYLLDGEVCTPDPVRARHLLQQAANSGHAYAQYTMFHVCQKTNAPQEARAWIERSALAGYDRAQYDWALILEKEPGRFQEALAQLVRAADRGNTFAQKRLIQFRSIGVTPVDEHAHPFFWESPAQHPLPRIFVSIASYRDPETPHTLRDLFAKAKHPDRIQVGILWQAVVGEDDDCMAIPAQAPRAQLRTITVHPRDSKGACWARSRILTELRRDEAYVLQIDSHMRFVTDWDEKMLTMLQRCGSDRALLSTYPIEYKPPDERAPPSIPILAASKFNHRGILMPKARALDYGQRPSKPIANPFLSAGFLFGPAAAFDEVPYDPHLYFIGEEISLAARLWTHGWNVYSPDDVLIYHFYGKPAERPRHWSDNPQWGELDNTSFARLRHLFGIETSHHPTALVDLQRYGLGSERTLEAFENYADVNLRQQLIGPAGARGQFAPHPARTPATVHKNPC